ncbi:MAG: chemotaxis response regulator protein-glutamate methylesterase [Leptospiraceae bacterium]|nr:chemotaxis response regulator protein-glutamate methylesterase [Leptospiraceae bacterium]
MSKIKVAIVDDSALVRQVISEIVKTDSFLELLFTAPDPLFALEKMKTKWPDVIILDVEMPRMDGITFLKKIMSERPTPVIICSSLTTQNSDLTMQALSAGAIEIVAKPQIGLKNFLTESTERFKEAIRAAGQSNMARVKRFVKSDLKTDTKENVIVHKSVDSRMFTTTDKVVAIGTSTGGTIALEFILKKLDVTCPGIVIVQHMPEKFTRAFADRLNAISKIEVKEATGQERVTPGKALIAPGNFHMSLKRSGAQYHVDVNDGPLVSRHRPSVDVLFRSVAKSAGPNAIGIIMTGMGDDGSSGLKEMHDIGAVTYAQDEESCVVYGMPKEAVKKGAVDKIVSLEDLPAIIQNYGK